MFEEFKKAAEKALQNITHYEETDDAFIFYNDGLKQDGVIVILKDKGIVLTMSQYIMTRNKK